MTTRPDQCWVIHDGAAGNRRQAVALAEALGWDFEEKTIVPGLLAKMAAPRLPPFLKRPFGGEFSAAKKNPPAYVIGCGRQAALAAGELQQGLRRISGKVLLFLDTCHAGGVIPGTHSRDVPDVSLFIRELVRADKVVAAATLVIEPFAIVFVHKAGGMMLHLAPASVDFIDPFGCYAFAIAKLEHELT